LYRNENVPLTKPDINHIKKLGFSYWYSQQSSHYV